MVRPKLTQQREIVEALRTDYSVRQICEVLGFTRSSLYYHPKQDPSEAVLRDEIETFVLPSVFCFRNLSQVYSINHTKSAQSA